MERNTSKKKLNQVLSGLSGVALVCASAVAVGGHYGGYDDDDGKWGGWGYKKSYELKGDCAFLPADRATEFHGNHATANLLLGMAGNQWVVFDEALRQFNLAYGSGDGAAPAHKGNSAGATWTLAELQKSDNRIYTQLIPPGQIRKQIKSGCMTVGNDEERNFLPMNIQVDFDVFASTNYNLMQDLANNGFIDEAVPYIKNKLDLMVAYGNSAGTGKDIGIDSYTGNTDFDKQFDIIMDMLSGAIITSNLDHINEGIHNAANNYMGAAHDYIRANDTGALINMTYKLADGTDLTANMSATDWVQAALKNVATPQAGSPGAERLVSRDAGENHSSHDLADNSCIYSGDSAYDGHANPALSGPTYKFCEYATLNKADTHESRVHHVETPNGIQGNPGYVPVDVGFVWITELAYVLAEYGGSAGTPPTPDPAPVEGMVGLQTIGNLGIPTPTTGTGAAAVNAPGTYSLALLATSKNKEKGRAFIKFLRSATGQAVYTDGGFTGLTADELDKGKCYARPEAGASASTDRTGPGSCPDWLWNGSF